MTRPARLVLPGWVHHVTQRGNNRQAVFHSDNDRLVYLRLVAEYFPRHGLTMIGYDLMTNHSHLAVIPDSEDSLALGVGQGALPTCEIGERVAWHRFPELGAFDPFGR